MAKIPYKSGLELNGDLQLSTITGNDNSERVLTIDSDNVVRYSTGITKNVTLDMVTSAGNATGNDVILSGSSYISNLFLPLPEGGFAELYLGVPGSTGYTAPIVSYLNDLTDVNISTPSTGQALVYDGSIWKNQSVVTDLSNYYTKQQSDNKYLSTGTTLFNGDYNSLTNKPDLSQYALNDGSNANGHWGIGVDYAYNSDYAENANGANYASEAGYTYFAETAGFANQTETAIFWGNISSEIISSTGSTINRLLGVDTEGYARQFTQVTLRNFLGLGSAAYKNESGTWNIDITGNAYTAYFADESNNSSFATLAGAAIAWGNREANFDEPVSDLTFLAGRGTDEVIKNVSKDFLKTWLGLGYWAYQNAIGGNEIITSVGYEGNDLGVAKMLRWSNYGSNHVVFDGSKGVAPNGAAIDPNNAQQAWVSTYPTLMGWNGAYTYGVRVDNARIADSGTKWSNQVWQDVNKSGTLTFMTNNNGGWGYSDIAQVQASLGLGSAAYNDKSKVWAKAGDGNADHYYIQHYWDGTGWNIEAQNDVSDEQANIHLVNINGFARSETLQSITDRGSITSNSIVVYASEGREVYTYLPALYTTDDIVSGHAYKWYTDTWTVGNVRSGGQPSKAFDIRFNDYQSYFRILTNGNVGIGTTTPGYKLDVNGTAKATNVIATDSLAIPIGPPSSMEAGKAYLYIGT